MWRPPKVCPSLRPNHRNTVIYEINPPLWIAWYYSHRFLKEIDILKSFSNLERLKYKKLISSEVIKKILDNFVALKRSKRTCIITCFLDSWLDVNSLLIHFDNRKCTEFEKFLKINLKMKWIVKIEYKWLIYFQSHRNYIIIISAIKICSIDMNCHWLSLVISLLRIWITFQNPSIHLTVWIWDTWNWIYDVRSMIALSILIDVSCCCSVCSCCCFRCFDIFKTKLSQARATLQE